MLSATPLSREATPVMAESYTNLMAEWQAFTENPGQRNLFLLHHKADLMLVFQIVGLLIQRS